MKLLLGGPIIAGATLSRFFALHVFVIPGMLIAFVGLHLLMVLKLGINEWPMPGRLVRKATYEAEYHELTRKDGAPFVPYAIWKDILLRRRRAGGGRGLCCGISVPLAPPASPTRPSFKPYPSRITFFSGSTRCSRCCRLRWKRRYFDRSRTRHRRAASASFSFGEGEKSWRTPPHRRAHRPAHRGRAAILHASCRFQSLEPGNECVERQSRSRKIFSGRTALERQGALVFQGKQCRNCHALGEKAASEDRRSIPSPRVSLRTN